MSVLDQISVSKRLPPSEWVLAFKAEYLDTFLPQGGSTVRFLSGGDRSLAAVQHEIASAAAKRGFPFVLLDPSKPTQEGRNPDFHSLDRFVFALTRAIDWRTEARVQVLNALEARGVTFPPGVVLPDIERVAEFNGRSPQDLLSEYQRLVTTLILKDHRMARDFRVAIAALGRAQIIPEELSPSTEEILLGWLRGENSAGSSAALKRILIQERINKSNAKFVLISLCNWLRSVGKPGVVVCLDFRAYERVKPTKAQLADEHKSKLRAAILGNAGQAELTRLVNQEPVAEDGPFYTPGAYIKGLDLLRHIVDDVERLPGFALIVLGTPKFFDDRPSFEKERRFSDYNALQTRIGLEVHDVERQNPSAALVHLEAN